MAEQDEFTKAISRWVDTFTSISVSAVGVMEGAPKILHAKVQLLTDSEGLARWGKLISSSYWGISYCRKIDAEGLGQFISSVRNGQIPLENSNALLQQNNPADRVYSSYFDGLSFLSDLSTANPRMPTLTVTGGSRNILLSTALCTNNFESRLRSLNTPYTDFLDLYQSFGLPERWAHNDNCFIELSACPPAKVLARSRLESGSARLVLWAGINADTSKVRIGYQQLRAEAIVERGSIGSAQILWAPHEGDEIGAVHLDTADNPTLRYFLNYDDELVQSGSLSDAKVVRNQRLAIYKAFDPNLSKLRSLIFDKPAKSDARNLEDGVAELLAMLGFSVTQHGRPAKLSDGPDLVAISPGGQVVVLECSTGHPTEGDQVQKLMKRLEAVRRAQKSAGWGRSETLGLVVTSLGFSEIAASVNDVETKGILVVAAETLNQWIEQAELPPKPDELINQWIRRVQIVQGGLGQLVK